MVAAVAGKTLQASVSTASDISKIAHAAPHRRFSADRPSRDRNPQSWLAGWQPTSGTGTTPLAVRCGDSTHQIRVEFNIIASALARASNAAWCRSGPLIKVVGRN
jgi:hypothetical protein